MTKIIFGPTGIGPVANAVSNLEEYHRRGFKAAEVLFTYQIYIKKEDAIEIGKAAKRLGIFLSVHSPYYVNLNSKEKVKIEASKRRILKSCEIANYLGARRVVIHPGFYSGMKSEEAREIIREHIVEIMKEIKKNNWDVEVCVEVMGKRNVFGSIDEVSWLVKETGCGFCIDFAHVLARYGKNMFEEIRAAFPSKNWQCHFSGIEFGEAGEKNHKTTTSGEWKKLLGFLKGLDKEVVIINESPTAFEDSVEGMKVWEEMGIK